MDDARARLWELLEGESTLALATVVAGRPTVAPLFYVPWGGALCWLSSPTSRHSQAVEAQGWAAATVFASTFDWAAIRGAQLEGRVEVVDGPDRTEVLAAYTARFSLGETFAPTIEGSRLYRLVPTWARLLDNSAGFGGRVEFEPCVSGSAASPTRPAPPGPSGGPSGRRSGR